MGRWTAPSGLAETVKPCDLGMLSNAMMLSLIRTRLVREQTMISACVSRREIC